MRFATLLLLLACGPRPAPAPTGPIPPSYPDTPREEIVDAFHGVEVEDPYRWLEEMESEPVGAWIERQNALTASVLEEVPQRNRFRERLEALWNHARYSVPREEAGTLFFRYNPGLLDQDQLMRADGPEAEPALVLDPNHFSEDGTVSLAFYAPSPDGRHLAYAVSDAGSDWRTVRVLDLETGEPLEDQLERVKFSGASWHPDGSGFWYSRYPIDPEDPEALAHQQAWFHRLGTPQSEDLLVAENPDAPEQGFGAYASDDDQWLIVEVWQGSDDHNRVWLRPLDAGPDTPLTRLLDDNDAEYDPLTVVDGTLILRTTLDAPKGRVVAIDLDAPEPAQWRELIAEADAPLERATRVGDHLVLTRLDHAKSAVAIHALDGTHERDVELPGPGSVGRISGDRDSATGWLRFTSFTRPGSVYRLDSDTGALTLWREPELPFASEDYVTEQVFYESYDGTRVPMFLTHRADVEPDGGARVLLYGYGGFDNAITPFFRVPFATWLEAGGVLAVANLRGGGEYGEAWHRAGTKTEKQHVFDDFASAAEWLIAEGWTEPEHLGIHGRSNGGLLVGATLTQRPDLFGAALPAVGVLDMLRYHRFTIGWAWAGDYGTVEDPAEFAALHAYSPVHRAPMAAYPPTLITTADHDDRVVPLHSYKFAAALQYAQLGAEPILLRVDTRAGHGAGKSVAMAIEEWADQLGFLAWALDLEVR